MSWYSDVIMWLFIAFFGALILFVIFGETTVRRLRKNTELRDALGMDIISGKDILNVATALSMSRHWNRRLRNTAVGSYFADADLLYKHTSVVDRVMARLIHWTFVITIIGLMSLFALHRFGMV